jgi:hypothetical protein
VKTGSGKAVLFLWEYMKLHWLLYRDTLRHSEEVNNAFVKYVHRVSKLSICGIVGNGLRKTQGNHKAVAQENASSNASNTTEIYIRSYDWPYINLLNPELNPIC